MDRFTRCMALSFLLPMAQVEAQNTSIDYYSPIIQWQQLSGLDVTPIHVGLLPNGNLFFVNAYNFLENPQTNLTAPGFEPEYVFLMQPTPAYTPQPAAVLIQPLLNPSPLTPLFDQQANTIRFKTLACSGHSLMADGTVFFASGADALVNLNLYNSGYLPESLTVDGIAESFTFNALANTWTRNPDTTVPGPVTGRPLRWYATVTRLADERMLVTGGYEKVFPQLSYNPSVEIFDPATNSWTTLSTATDTPAGIENPDYTHVFQFPYAYNDINIAMMIGGSGEPLFLLHRGQDKFWLRTQQYRPGAREYIDSAAPEKVFPNHGASSAMLPIRLPEASWGYSNGSIITAGGAAGTAMESNIDVYDPSAAAWRSSIPMHGRRRDPLMVILPDGRVLLLAGYDNQSAVSQAGVAEYVDPKNNFAVSQGSAYMPETRGYHTVTVLLPDGRVLVGSGNVDGRDGLERSDFRYYYPDYMFKPRPQIVHANETINVAGYSLILVPHKTEIGEAALVGLGSMTHSFDMSQRHVQLRTFDPRYTIRLVAGAWVQVGPEQCLDAQNLCYDMHFVYAPTTREVAPPGYYMLFILDRNRVPSPGKMVRLQ